jgi:electron transfer flavoprotein alpha subunit
MELPHNIPKAVLFFAELKDGGLHRNALELSSLSKKLAGELGGSTAAVVITGNDGHRLAEEIIAYGADKVYTIEDARFEKYQPEAYSIAIEQACKIADPNVLLLGHSLRGADLAPRLAWRLRVPLVTDCIDVLVDAYSKRVSAVRPVYGSKGLAVFTSSGRPHIATVRSKAKGEPARSCR